MEAGSYVDLVVRARRGDVEAFGGLVERFQDMAVSYAWAELGDLADAVDATQEAFVDALRKIDLLRDPEAFPGWLQRIVTTHCGRVRRQRQVPSHLAQDRMFEPGPDSVVADREEAERLRRAVGRLPPHERVVVAMHYLGGCTYVETADLLGISAQAARKRAHTARARLRQDWQESETDVRETFEAVRPSRDRRFTNETMLFAAIAREDVDLACRLLRSNPRLVEAEEDWDDATADEAGLLPAREATPLLRAVGRGNRELVELLLRHGAAVDATCGCAGGESPLWAATVSGDVELVRLFLDEGADPNRSAFGGVTPLHVATMRGYETISQLLLDAGADSWLADERGRRPRDWARLKGRHLHGADEEHNGAMGGDRSRWLESGIKAINLFAPLRQGSLVRWVGPPGTGSLVVLVELAHNLARFEGLDTTIIGFEHQGLSGAELRHACAELDPATRAHVDLAGVDLPGDARRRAFADAVARAHAASRAHRRQLIVVAAHPEHLADIEAETPRLLEAGDLVILLDFTGEATADTALPAEATITLSQRLARAGLYPAIDPERTEGRYPDDAHAATAESVKRLVARYRTIGSTVAFQDPGADVEWTETARRIHRQLTQPFQTTEPFTGQPGLTVSIDETLRAIRTVLDPTGPRSNRPSASAQATARNNN